MQRGRAATAAARAATIRLGTFTGRRRCGTSKARHVATIGAVDVGVMLLLVVVDVVVEVAIGRVHLAAVVQSVVRAAHVQHVDVVAQVVECCRRVL